MPGAAPGEDVRGIAACFCAPRAIKSGYEHSRGNQRHRLAGMGHDERGLGVAVRFLMQAFDPRHLAALLGAFEAINQKHETAVLAHPAPVQKVADRAPGGCQSVQREGGRVEKMEQTIIAAIGYEAKLDSAKAPTHGTTNCRREGGLDGLGRLASRQPLPTVQCLRQTRLPLQRPTAPQAARPLLPTQLRVSRQENLPLYPSRPRSPSSARSWPITKPSSVQPTSGSDWPSK